MAIWSMLKTGLHHPKEALMYLTLGSQRYYLIQAEMMERNIKPDNRLEKLIVKPTDIHEHLATLYMLTSELNLGIIVELGTRGGESTIALLEAAKQIGGRVYSIDMDPCLEAKVRIQTCGLQEYWTFIQGDDLKIEWNKPIDHLFIDTLHTFNQTIRKLKKYEPYVIRGGIITLHDIVSFPETLQAINSYIEGKTDLRLYKYFNCSGLAIIFKGYKSSLRAPHYTSEG